jgi:hypothetical protein
MKSKRNSQIFPPLKIYFINTSYLIQISFQKNSDYLADSSEEHPGQ